MGLKVNNIKELKKFKRLPVHFFVGEDEYMIYNKGKDNLWAILWGQRCCDVVYMSKTASQEKKFIVFEFVADGLKVKLDEINYYGLNHWGKRV